MKRAVIVAILVIVSIIVPLIQIGISETVPFSYPSMYIQSPAPFQETIYQNSPSLIQVYAYTNKSSEVQCVGIFYSIDDSPNRTLSLSKMQSLQDSYGVNYGYGTLDNLTFGFHTINAYSTYTQGAILSTLVKFFVNATSNNPLILVSPINTTYNNTEVPITCIIDDQLTIEYSLDDAGYLPSDSNLTLTGLSEGQHNLTLKAVSEYGTYSEQTISSLYQYKSLFQLCLLRLFPLFQLQELWLLVCWCTTNANQTV